MSQGGLLLVSFSSAACRGLLGLSAHLFYQEVKPCEQENETFQ
jgi:hypothetical protein